MREYIGHKRVKRFQMAGTLKDNSEFSNGRIDLENALASKMAEAGYFPTDIPAGFSVEYNEEEDNYNFMLTLFGIFVGKARVARCKVVFGQTLILEENSTRESTYSTF